MAYYTTPYYTYLCSAMVYYTELNYIVLDLYCIISHYIAVS